MSDAEVRLVPMTRKQRNSLANWDYMDIVAAWDAAPADPAEAARNALTDCEYRSAGMGEEAQHISELYDIHGCRIIRANAVLAALGFVVSSTETSTPDA